MFSNLRGCDGQRVYFNGCSRCCPYFISSYSYSFMSSITVNGETVARSEQFSVEEVEVSVASVDLEDIRSYRNAVRSRTLRADAAPSYPRVQVLLQPSFLLPLLLQVDFCLSGELCHGLPPPSPSFPWQYHTPEEEIMLGPACWLWDYLRRWGLSSCFLNLLIGLHSRSGQGGYFLPLSGGVDSSSTAVLVHRSTHLHSHCSNIVKLSANLSWSKASV